MIVHYGKLIDGYSHFALIEIEVKESSNSKPIIIDNCSWKRINEAHKNAGIGEGLLNFKDSVIKGMHFALDHINNVENKEIVLNDISVQYTDSSIYSRFAVGLISIFEGLEIDLLESDLASIDKLVSKGFQNDSQLVSLEEF